MKEILSICSMPEWRKKKVREDPGNEDVGRSWRTEHGEIEVVLNFSFFFGKEMTYVRFLNVDRGNYFR